MDNLKNSFDFCRQVSCLAKYLRNKSEYDVKNKLKYDICCIGRSMIEMLGVLAIITVLSVGGIAGYSKSMQMYKLNKWTANLVQIITDIQTANINQKSYGDRAGDITRDLQNADVISNSQIGSNRRDILGNYFTVYLRNNYYGIIRLNIEHLLKAGNDGVECCKKLFELGQYYNSNWVVINDSFRFPICGKAASAEYAKFMQCKPYNLAAIAKNCENCRTNQCRIQFLLDNNVF